MNNKLVPALIGGVSIFLVSVLGSLIPRAGFCTCLLAVLGGMLAAYLYIRRSPTPVSSGDGLIVGALAGAITGALRLAYLAMLFVVNRAQIETMSRAIEERMRQGGINFDFNLSYFILAGGILAVVMMVAIEAIGGLIGVALFEKRKGEIGLPPPPMPPDESNLPGGADGL